MTLELTGTSALLANELGDRDGYIWDAELRRQKLNEAIDWLSQYLPTLRDAPYSTVAGQRDIEIYGSRAILVVELNGRRLNRDDAPADDHALGTASSGSLSYRVLGAMIVFSRPIAASEAGTGNLTVYAAYNLLHFPLTLPSTTDAPDDYVLWLVLKAAELCLLWANAVLARRGRDIGSLRSADEYRQRIDGLVAARFVPQGAGARPLKQ